MPISFELCETWSREALAVQWQALEERADAPFFLTWSWIGTWLELTGLTPALLIGRRGEETVLLGLLVATRRKEAIFAAAGLYLHATGDGQQDVITIEYNGFLVDRSAGGKAERAALAYLLGGVSVGGKRRDELYLRGVAEDFRRHVPERGSIARVLKRQPSWRVDLQGVRESAKPYLQMLGPNTRHQIRRSLRLYERTGPVSLARAGPLEEARAFMQGLKALHQAHWNARGEPGAFAFPFYVRFHERIIETCLPKGTVELVRVSRGDEPVGYLYNFVHRGHVYAYLSGFRYEGDARCKPGLVTHALCIEQHARDGNQVYDFMAGRSRYKANLGEPGPAIAHLLLGRPTPVLRLENALRAVRRAAMARLRPMPAHPAGDEAEG
jgi:CelD/BcsL family acetyltransferase involved in cellulose biosynthesis